MLGDGDGYRFVSQIVTIPCRGITYILSAILFRIVPTSLEIGLVCGILVRLILSCSTSYPVYSLYCLAVIQIWLGLRRNRWRDNCCVYVVHRHNHFMEACTCIYFCPLHVYFECRTRFRREANKADNRAASVIVDSLINYEAVKVRTCELLLG